MTPRINAFQELHRNESKDGNYCSACLVIISKEGLARVSEKLERIGMRLAARLFGHRNNKNQMREKQKNVSPPHQGPLAVAVMEQQYAIDYCSYVSHITL